MKHDHRSAISVYGNRSSRSFAFAFVILLHAGLIIVFGNGLGGRIAPPAQYATTTRVIEPPPVTKPRPNWQPPTTTTVTPPIDLPPVDWPTENTPPTGITQGIAPTKTDGTPVARSVIVPPRSDARHPLSQPAYPASARRAGVEGTVELSLFVLANGRIGEVKVARSSGSVELDEAAMKEARRAWRLLPQQVDGVAVAAWHNIAVTFRLHN